MKRNDVVPESDINMRQKHRQTEGISCNEKQNRSSHSLVFLSVKETPLRKSRGGLGEWERDSGPKLAAPFRLCVCLIQLISCDCWTSSDGAD